MFPWSHELDKPLLLQVVSVRRSVIVSTRVTSILGRSHFRSTPAPLTREQQIFKIQACWRDGLVVKRRGPKFCHQHPHWAAHIRGSETLFWPWREPTLICMCPNTAEIFSWLEYQMTLESLGFKCRMVLITLCSVRHAQGY